MDNASALSTPPTRKKAAYHHCTAAEAAVIRREYATGRLYKDIGAMLGHSERWVYEQRVKLGLPKRRGDKQDKKLTFYVTETERTRLRTHARQLGLPLGAYLRSLINKSLEKAK